MRGTSPGSCRLGRSLVAARRSHGRQKQVRDVAGDQQLGEVLRRSPATAVPGRRTPCLPPCLPAASTEPRRAPPSCAPAVAERHRRPRRSSPPDTRTTGAAPPPPLPWLARPLRGLARHGSEGHMHELNHGGRPSQILPRVRGVLRGLLHWDLLRWDPWRRAESGIEQPKYSAGLADRR